MSQPGVFISKTVPYATECRIIQNQFALITKITKRDALSVELAIKDEPHLNLNARDEVQCPNVELCNVSDRSLLIIEWLHTNHDCCKSRENTNY